MTTERIVERPTEERVAEAFSELERRWDGEGQCSSCGWHAALYEHRVTYDDVAEALRNGGLLELGCQNYEHGDPIGHRGVVIRLSV